MRATVSSDIVVMLVMAVVVVLVMFYDITDTCLGTVCSL